MGNVSRRFVEIGIYERSKSLHHLQQEISAFLQRYEHFMKIQKM